MTIFAITRTMSQIVDGLAEALSETCGVGTADLHRRISQVLAIWAAERSLDSFAKTVAEFSRFIDVWNLGDGPVRGPLSVGHMAATVTRLRQAGAAHGSVLAYLTAMSAMLHRLGVMTSELRSGFIQLRRNHTARSTRKRARANVPTLHAEVARLLRGADPQLPRDVRNMVMVLILFEGMAQFSELVKCDRGAKKTDGLPVSDVTFEEGGTSVVTLLPSRSDALRRTVRLSTGATAWLKHWMAMRGNEPGSFFSYGKADPRGPQVTTRCDSLPLWAGPVQFKQLAFRHGTAACGLSAESLRLGRAVGLLDAGWNISRVAMFGGWTSTAALVRLLDAGLAVLPKDRRRREPAKLWWPLPVPSLGDVQQPLQLELRLVDAA